MRQPKTNPRALGAALTALGAFAALPAFAQDVPTPAAPGAPQPGPSTQPPPAPGTTQPAPTQSGAPATAAAPATPPPNYGLQYNGLFDGYYLFQFHNPKDADAINGRAYDIRHDSPTLALGELNVFENPHPSSFGFKATLDVGDTANINAGGSGSTGEARFRSLGQLYGTYAIGGSGAGVDFGKFYSPFGYEVIQSNGNYNYSRSIPFNLVPFYHFGARIYSAPGVLGLPGLTATGYITRALFNNYSSGVEGGSPQPAFFGQLNYAAPSGKFSFITTDGEGKDKPSGSIATKSFLSDNDFTYNFSSTVLAGFDYLYLQQSPDQNPKVTTTGLAVYFRNQFTPKLAYALRISGADAHGGGGEDARPYEITATYEIKSASNFLTRFEYRHDNANGKGLQPFQGGNTTDPDANVYSNQDTVSASEVFTF